MIIELILTIDTETGYPKLYYPDGFLGHEYEILSGPQARVTYDTLHFRYKYIQDEIKSHRTMGETNPRLHAPAEAEKAGKQHGN